MSRRMIAVAAAMSMMLGCLVDFSGYRTAPDGGAGSAQEGGSAGSAGAAGQQAGGAAGTSGSAGAEAGSAGQGGSAGQAGAAGQAGSAGQPGNGGTAGGGCGFDVCHPSQQIPPSGCSPCTQTVCGKLAFCCSTEWSFECVIEALATSACACGGLGCGKPVPVSTEGSCATSGVCNPVTGKTCSAGQCVLNPTNPVIAECQFIGQIETCQPCNPSTSDNCAAGLSCIADRCVRVCCENTDCQNGATCDKSVLPGTVGLCVSP